MLEFGHLSEKARERFSDFCSQLATIFLNQRTVEAYFSYLQSEKNVYRDRLTDLGLVFLARCGNSNF